MTAEQPPGWLDDPALTSVVLDAMHAAHHKPGSITMLELAEFIADRIRDEYAPRAAQPDVEASVVTEWAVRCHTSTGELHTGLPKRSRSVAQGSGERLTAINGADWWLVTRTRTTYADHVTDWTPADTGADT